MSTATLSPRAGTPTPSLDPRGAVAVKVPGASTEPVVTPRTIAGFAALVFGMFMAILDIQIVSSSLTQIQAGLSASADEISWVQTSYLIAEVVMIPLSGFLGRALSTRVLFSLSAAGFTLTSLLCATANSLEEMIVYRALQGFIGGGMIPSAMSAIYVVFPNRMRPAVQAMVGLTVTLAPTIGPTVGGYLTDLFSWHWLFLVNIIPGIVATVMAWTLIDFDKPDFPLLKRLDVLSVMALAVFLGSLEYFLEEGPGDDWFDSSVIVGFSIAALIGGAIFFWRTFSIEEPVVDLKVYRDRNFAVGSILTFVMGIGLYGLTYLYPLFLGRVRGYSSMQIGETVFVSGLAMFLAAPIVGRLSRSVDPRIVIFAGFCGFTLSCFELHPITQDWSFWELLWPQFLRGFSLMACMVPINILALGTLPPPRIKNASALFNLTRNLGGALGLAIITTVLNNRWDLHIARLHEATAWGRGAVEGWLATTTAALTPSLGAAADQAALKQLAGLARGQALVMAFSDVFLALTVLFACSAMLVVLIQKPKGPPPAAAADAH